MGDNKEVSTSADMQGEKHTRTVTKRGAAAPGACMSSTFCTNSFCSCCCFGVSDSSRAIKRGAGLKGVMGFATTYTILDERHHFSAQISPQETQWYIRTRCARPERAQRASKYFHGSRDGCVLAHFWEFAGTSAPPLIFLTLSNAILINPISY